MKKILLVDDDKEFNGLLSTALSPRGYIVTAVASGEEALTVVGTLNPDALLLDVKMPGMSGIETLRAIKKAHADFRTPVIVLTNDPSLDTISEGAELGIRSYVMKANESMQTIADTVDRLFAKK